MTHTAYDVYRHGQWLERVYYLANEFTADEVRKTLVEDDGYPPEITVHIAGRKTS
jgi:hypothetical protein